MPKSTMSIDVDSDPAFAAMGYITGMVDTISTDAFTGSILEFAHAKMSSEFDKQTNLIARGNTESFHHVYEWRMTGMQKGRLWKHKLRGHGAKREATFEWVASKKPIPTAKERYRMKVNPNDPNKKVAWEDVKRLKDRRYFFFWKAPIMEYNTRVTIAPKNAKALFIPMDENVRVRGFNRAESRDRHFVFSRHAVQITPGGEATKGKFTAQWVNFWTSSAPEIWNKQLQKIVEKDLTRTEVSRIATAQRKRTKTVGISTYGNAEQAFEAGRLFAQAQFMAKSRKYSFAAASQYVKDRP